MKRILEPLTIFLVDDDSDDRLLFDMALSDVLKDYKLVTFNDGTEIVEHLREEENRDALPNILFLDINMPFMNGLEALRVIRNELKIDKLPIAMYSTSNMDKDIAEALIAGANVYLTKPPSFDKLKISLHKIINTNMHYDKSNLKLETFLISV